MRGDARSPSTLLETIKQFLLKYQKLLNNINVGGFQQISCPLVVRGGIATLPKLTQHV